MATVATVVCQCQIPGGNDKFGRLKGFQQMLFQIHSSTQAGGFTTMAVLNQLERKLAKRTSVQSGGQVDNHAVF